MTPADDDRLAELTALADGTLQGRRRAQLLAEIGRSPELAQRFEKQRRAVAALRSVDEIDGRSAVTVFYEKDGRRIGYTILSGDPIDPPDEASTANREGVTLRGLSADGRVIVTWLRDGRTCVLSGTDVDAATLLDLAAWNGKGAVEF